MAAALDRSICIFYLYRTTHPVSDLQRFFRAFVKYTSPGSCSLAILVKGETSEAQRAALAAAIHDLDARFASRIIMVPDEGYDISSYSRAAEAVTDAKFICCCNTYSEPLISGWLDKLAREVVDNRAGLAGATGSYEATLPETPFPNPALRTNAFFIRRDLFLNLEGLNTKDRYAALAFESGRNSMTRQLLAIGLRVIVVNGSGEAFDIERCREADAFRSEGPQNLLVADNRTREYDAADETGKARLQRFAWGGRKSRRPLLRSLYRRITRALVRK